MALSKHAKENIVGIVKQKSFKNLSSLLAEYERIHGTKLVYEGKLKKKLQSIPGIKISKGERISWDDNVCVVSSKKMEYRCDLCGVNAPDEGALKSHLVGKKHLRKLAEVNGAEQANNGIAESSSITSANDKVKIEVQDSAADIITFKESVGGIRGARKEQDIDLDNSLEAMSLEEQSADQVAKFLFLPKKSSGSNLRHKGYSLSSSKTIDDQSEGALFGHLCPHSSGLEEAMLSEEAVYLNTSDPFCFVTVGVQGAGKSHTSSCVLESCLIPFQPGNVVKLKSPMTCLVLHYDQNTSSICEAAGLLSPNPSIKTKMNSVGHDVGAVPKDKSVILVSPAYYKQRKKFYGDYCTVKPLLFVWRSLTADHIKKIMRIESGDNQLYVASFLDLLRDYQRKAVVPDFADFMAQIRSVCNVGSQKGPLDQRIALLESLVAESPKNTELVAESMDLMTATKQGIHFIIADLTDPLLSKEEANSCFQVLSEQFRTLPTKGGKVLCLDEAHKYMDGVKSDGLSGAIVNAARLMRHDGIRLVVSTQSPKALAPELLELVTIACLHHFHSPDWWSYLQSKLPLNEDAFERILSLNPGEAVAFATSHNLSEDSSEGSHCLPLRIRQRITEDLGSSRRNS